MKKQRELLPVLLPRSCITFILLIIISLIIESAASSSSSYGESSSTSTSTSTSNSNSSSSNNNQFFSYLTTVDTAQEKSMSLSTFFSLLFFSAGFVIMFLACFVHSQRTSPLFSAPRRHRLPHLVPPPLPVKSLLSWSRVAFFIDDEEIIAKVGFDAVTLIRFHRLSLRIIFKCSILAFLVLLPINYTASNSSEIDYTDALQIALFTDFLKFTMANVESGSLKLWVHCIVTYIFTLIIFDELENEYKKYQTLRNRYMLTREAHLRTVLITDIPGKQPIYLPDINQSRACSPVYRYNSSLACLLLMMLAEASETRSFILLSFHSSRSLIFDLCHLPGLSLNLPLSLTH
jgi:hypothetical protein